MSSFEFGSIESGFPLKMTKQNYLWIWNATKIPPHIGISVGSNYFSLTYAEVEEMQVVSMIRKVKRSNIPLVLVELEKELDLKSTQEVFYKYTRAMVGGPTCLFPIRDVLNAGNEVGQLADLLAKLATTKNLQFHGVNLPEDYTKLPSYTVSEIMERIESLSIKK